MSNHFKKIIKTVERIIKIIQNKKFENYKFKYLLGFRGFLEGFHKYLKHRRYKQGHNLIIYTTYFIVKRITGKEPEGNY